MEQYISKEFPDGASVEAALLRAKAGGAIDIALQNKAPQYPYYTAQSNADIDAALNDLLNKGVFYKTIFSAINILTNGLDLDGGVWGIELVNADGIGYAIATSYGYPNGVVRKMRMFVGDTWKPWEWVNPPMVQDNEYRTTERFRRKPVYTMAINTKALGLGVVDDYPHGIANVDDIWVCGGSFIESGSNKLSIPYFGGISDHHVIASANRSVIHRINSSSVYVVTDMVVILKYTKLTDD